jgi:PTS system fructose-specific IIC component
MTIGIVPSVFGASLFVPEFRHRKKASALGELIACAHRAGVVSNEALVREVLALRERLGSTSVGNGTALPHARSIAVIEPRVVLGRSARGVDWDGEKVHLVLLALSPGDATADAHIDLVGIAAALVRTRRNRQRMLEAEGFDEIAALLQSEAS